MSAFDNIIKLAKQPARLAWRTLKVLLRFVKPSVLRNQDWINDLKLLRGSPSFNVVFDVGANNGQTTSEFLKLLPNAKIIAVEPLPELARELASTHSSNPRVTVYNHALGLRDCEKEFKAYAFKEASSFLEAIPDTLPNLEGLHESHKIKVKMRSLDSLIEESGINSVDILKLDAQGYELQIINGALGSLGKIQAIYSEVLFGRIYKDQTEFWQMDQKLRENNFWLFKIYHSNQALDGRLLWADALWINQGYIPEVASPNRRHTHTSETLY